VKPRENENNEEDYTNKENVIKENNQSTNIKSKFIPLRKTANVKCENKNSELENDLKNDEEISIQKIDDHSEEVKKILNDEIKIISEDNYLDSESNVKFLNELKQEKPTNTELEDILNTLTKAIEIEKTRIVPTNYLSSSVESSETSNFNKMNIMSNNFYTSNDPSHVPNRVPMKYENYAEDEFQSNDNNELNNLISKTKSDIALLRKESPLTCQERKQINEPESNIIEKYMNSNIHSQFKKIK